MDRSITGHRGESLKATGTLFLSKRKETEHINGGKLSYVSYQGTHYQVTVLCLQEIAVDAKKFLKTGDQHGSQYSWINGYCPFYYYTYSLSSNPLRKNSK